MQPLQVINTDDVVFTILRVGKSMFCGSESHIDIWDAITYTKKKTITKHHTRPITALLCVWDRIIWSSSLDNTIGIWS